jgi:hypothetical protein
MENEKVYKCAFILYEEGVEYDRRYFREIFAPGSFYPKAQFICPAELNQKRIKPDIAAEVSEIALANSRGIVVATITLSKRDHAELIDLIKSGKVDSEYAFEVKADEWKDIDTNPLRLVRKINKFHLIEFTEKDDAC